MTAQPKLKGVGENRRSRKRARTGEWSRQRRNEAPSKQEKEKAREKRAAAGSERLVAKELGQLLEHVARHAVDGEGRVPSPVLARDAVVDAARP